MGNNFKKIIIILQYCIYTLSTTLWSDNLLEIITSHSMKKKHRSDMMGFQYATIIRDEKLQKTSPNSNFV